MSVRAWRIVTVLLIVLTCARVASTHLVFSQTIDEPAHIGTGHEFLTENRYQIDVEHPPLPRMLMALPFIDAPTTNPDHLWERGNDLLARDGRYIHNLAAARRPNLLFLAIALAAVALLAQRYFGELASCLALALFASLPPLLAHAGLATTDIAGTAGFAVCLLAISYWCDDPSWLRTLLLGIAFGFAAACKYSTVVFVPIALVILLVARRRFAPGRIAIAGLVALLVVWATFRFQTGTMREAYPAAAPAIAEVALGTEAVIDVPLPAPSFFLGLLRVKSHNAIGHEAFLFGKVSSEGESRWEYFPVALGVKTPIPYLMLVLTGAALLIRRRIALELLLIAAAILGVAIASRINIGVRHILPMYVPLSIVASYPFIAGAKWLRGAAVAAMAWLVIGSALAHPDYLPWMNALAGPHPERVLLDSNLDWGQDLWRFARECRKRGIDNPGYLVNTTIRGSSIGIERGRILEPHVPIRGWLVVSEHSLAFARKDDPTAYRWLTDGRKFERIGASLRLYYVP